MSEGNVIRCSNDEYDRLGDRIRRDPQNIAEKDLKIIQSLRVSYKEPLAIIFNSIEKLAHNVDPNCICTYRVKRIESIISKLIRFPKMRVNRAEDIAGCRCIMSTTEHVYELYDKIVKKENTLPFEIKGSVHDYIQEPKESGYRSIHIIAVLRGGDNRRVEIQLRGMIHHNWATLVETTDLVYKTKLKETGRDTNADLYDFHRLLSKPFEQINIKEKELIAEIAIRYNYIQKIGTIFERNHVDVRKKWYSLNLTTPRFFLIATGSDGIPEFQAFDCFEEAEGEYFDKYINSQDNKNIVLTHLVRPQYEKISVAYSNYFLVFNATFNKVLICISDAVVSSYKRHQFRKFRLFFKSFIDVVSLWMDKQLIESTALKNYDKSDKMTTEAIKEWMTSFNHHFDGISMIIAHTNAQLSFSVFHLIYHRFMKREVERFKHRYANG